MSDNDMPGTQPRIRSPNDRRFDQRFSVRSLCSFKLMETNGSGPTMTQQGAAYSLNVSADGILLLLDREPLIQQLVEIHNSQVSSQEVATLFEVRWVKALPIGSIRPRHLAGCRLAFGRVPFFLFQRRNVEGPFSVFPF
jgi:hypothetical protein